MKSWITAVLLETVTLATFIPSMDKQEGEHWVYSAIEMPTTDLDFGEDSGVVVNGKFWVDGTTAISVVDDEYYLWINATVHSPQLPIGSELYLFGQIDLNEELKPKEELVKEENSAPDTERIEEILEGGVPAAETSEDGQAIQARRMQDASSQENQPTAAPLVVEEKKPLSSWLCKLKFNSNSRGEGFDDAMKADIEWSMWDFSGPTKIDADTDFTKGSITDLLTAEDTIFTQVPDVRNFSDEYKFWGINYALSEIEIYEKTQYINTCAMWRKLSYPDTYTAGTDYAGGLLNLELDQEIALNVGYQVHYKDARDPQNRKTFYYGERNTVDVLMYSGAVTSTVAALATALSFLTFF